MSFEMDISRFVNRVKDGSNRTLRKIGVAGYQIVTNLTPVDTGRAKGNWYPGLNLIDRTATENVGFDATRADAEFSNVKPGDTMNISNSLPYIVQLENGSSMQAPQGMVRRTMLLLKRKIEGGAFND